MLKNALVVFFLAVMTAAVLLAGIRTRGSTGADLSDAVQASPPEEGQQVQFLFEPSGDGP